MSERGRLLAQAFEALAEAAAGTRRQQCNRCGHAVAGESTGSMFYAVCSQHPQSICAMPLAVEEPATAT
jgi:hypothetical protein